MRASTIMMAGALALLPYMAFAQSEEVNRLDCWFSETDNDLRCPNVELQTGRDARVDTTFGIVDAAEPAALVPEPVAREDLAVTPPPRRLSSNTTARSATPSCKTYKTYNAATKTYRSYDRVVRPCP